MSLLIARWRTPDANVGLPTGQRPGVPVVAFDLHAAGAGSQAFEHAGAAGRSPIGYR